MFHVSAQVGSGRARGHGTPDKTSKGSNSKDSRVSSSSKPGSSTKHGPAVAHVPAASAAGEEPLSFLFVVNEFVANFEPLPGQVAPATDQWGNMVPPVNAASYESEEVGIVFRYCQGLVTPAAGYRWYRPRMGEPGSIARYDAANNFEGYLVAYKTQSVFACSAHLPIVVSNGDSSLGASFIRRGCACDHAYDVESSTNTSYTAWNLLHFSSSPDMAGVSLAMTDGTGAPFVPARDPSWIPTLVPRVFENTRDDQGIPRSRGLAGEMPLVIGLMAFHGRRNHASDVFSNQFWHYNQWRGPNSTPRYPLSENNPRGFVVSVCLDITIPPNYTTDTLMADPGAQMIDALEWSSILVRG